MLTRWKLETDGMGKWELVYLVFFARFPSMAMGTSENTPLDVIEKSALAPCG